MDLLGENLDCSDLLYISRWSLIHLKRMLLRTLPGILRSVMPRCLLQPHRPPLLPILSKILEINCRVSWRPVTYYLKHSMVMLSNETALVQITDKNYNNRQKSVKFAHCATFLKLLTVNYKIFLNKLLV